MAPLRIETSFSLGDPREPIRAAADLRSQSALPTKGAST